MMWDYDTERPSSCRSCRRWRRIASLPLRWSQRRSQFSSCLRRSPRRRSRRERHTAARRHRRRCVAAVEAFSQDRPGRTAAWNFGQEM